MLQKELREPFQKTEEFYDTFKDAIKLRLRSDVPVGVCLSGGIDSSSIVTVLTKEFDKKDLRTFSAVYEKGEKADESAFINKYRANLKYMYFTQPCENSLMNDIGKFIKCHSEPVGGLGPYAQFKVMQLAKNHVVVLLDGQGADEEFAGYHYFFGSYFKQLLLELNFRILFSEVIDYLRNYRSMLAFKYFLLYMAPGFMKNCLSKISHNFILKDFYRHNKKYSNVGDYLYSPKNLRESLIQHFEYKLEHLLKWEDHNSMWHSLEARVPFLDHRIVERTLSLPANRIIKNATTKYFLREAMEGRLPEIIRTRKDKMGFETPWDKWSKTRQFQELIIDTLRSKKFRERGYLEPEKCYRAYKHHLEGKISIPQEIWKWINLELWARKFIDN